MVKILLSSQNGEYVVPSDVVSMLGDGDTQSGAEVLENLINSIRMKKTGSKEQPLDIMSLLRQKD